MALFTPRWKVPLSVFPLIKWPESNKDSPWVRARSHLLIFKICWPKLTKWQEAKDQASLLLKCLNKKPKTNLECNNKKQEFLIKWVNKKLKLYLDNNNKDPLVNNNNSNNWESNPREELTNQLKKPILILLQLFQPKLLVYFKKKEETFNNNQWLRILNPWKAKLIDSTNKDWNKLKLKNNNLKKNYKKKNLEINSIELWTDLLLSALMLSFMLLEKTIAWLKLKKLLASAPN